MYSDGDTLKGWVAPFGHPGIKACSQLPQDFRSVPRPSSPLGAKASTRCPSHAHKTPDLQFQNLSPRNHKPYPPCTGTIHAPNSTGRNACPIPQQAIILIILSTHKTLLTAAAQPALSHAVLQRRSLGQTPMPAKPRTPLGSPLNPACNKHTPTQKPPEVSCAPRSAPEPDSQSPKNKHTETIPTGTAPYRHASNPRALQEPTPAYPISLTAAQPNHA